MKTEVKSDQQFLYNSGWQKINKHTESDEQAEFLYKKIEEITSSIKILQNTIGELHDNKAVQGMENRINHIEDCLNQLNSLDKKSNMNEDIFMIREELDSQKEDYVSLKKSFETLKKEVEFFEQDITSKIRILILGFDSIKRDGEEKKPHKRNILSNIFKAE